MVKVYDPFNVEILKISDIAAAKFPQVTTLDTFDGASKNFHPQGLFSNEIFGAAGSRDRFTRFAYIDIKIPILHPLVYRTLGKLKRLYHEIITGKSYAIFDKELKDFVKSDPVDGETGYHFFMSHWQQIQFPENLSDLRKLNIDFINKFRKDAEQTRIVVAPAGFRDYVIFASGKEEEDQVNALYRKLIASSNAITKEMFEMSPKTYDRVRNTLQAAFNAIYEYLESIVKGKNKFLLGRVLTRQVIDGTRNVFTTQNLETKRLLSEDGPDSNSTGIGLFQFLKAYRPKCLHAIKNGFLSEVFRSIGAPVKLVNPKTMHAEEVELSMESYNQWMAKEGLEKLFNLFGEEQRRHQPIVIEGYWLALKYNDGKVFKLFSDIDELPEGFDKKHVSPVTFAEFMYSQVYMIEKEVTLNVTRFPVTGFGSIYPSLPYLKVTLKSQRLRLLDQYWQDSGEVLREFPIPTEGFVNTLMPAPDKLGGMNADWIRINNQVPHASDCMNGTSLIAGTPLELLVPKQRQ